MESPDFSTAEIPEAKITLYLLRLEHPEGGSKARFFLARGFDPEHWERMADSLRAQATGQPIARTVAGRFGTKFVVDAPIPCPDGSLATIRTVWMIPNGTSIPRLVTAHPME